MQLRFAKTALPLSALAMLLFACGNGSNAPSSGSSTTAQDSTTQSGPLLETNAEDLAAAKRNSAKPIAPADLLARIKADTAAALVVNFWKTDCLKCLQTQQVLQNLQRKYGKLQVLSVNLDGEEMANGVNMVLQKSGITAEVLQVQGTDGTWRNDVSGGWQGNVPAIFIKAKDGGKQFYSREFKAEELEAMLKPLLL